MGWINGSHGLHGVYFSLRLPYFSMVFIMASHCTQYQIGQLYEDYTVCIRQIEL